MDNKISVILPVYNVENYLRENLDSIFNQSYSNYEVIAVNDGSTDSSLNILNEYKERYKDKLIIINQSNGGISNARNNGLKKASGDYIIFLDSDDFIDLDMFKDMISLASKDDSDIVISDIEFYWENNKDKNFIMYGLTNRFKVDNIHKKALLSSLGVWNKLIKKSFYDSLNVSFKEGSLYEDIEVITYLLAKANKISYLPKVKLYYRQRDNSIMTFRNDKCKDIYNVLIDTYNRFLNNDLLDTYHDEIEYLFIENLLLYGQYRFLMLDDYKEMIIKCKKMIKEYFPNYLNNPYFKQLSIKDKIFIRFNNSFTCGLFRNYMTRGTK